MGDVSDAQALTVPPAGWYPDRAEANLVRWWDGSQWTDQTQSTAPAAVAFEQPVSVAAFGFGASEQVPVGHSAPAAAAEILPAETSDSPAAVAAPWTVAPQTAAPQTVAFQTAASQAVASQTAASQTAASQTIASQTAVAAFSEPTASVAPQIVPGWYPDNRDPSLLRWWDGTQWTAHAAPAVPLTSPIPPVGSYGSGEPVSSPNNTMATLSLVLSIGSFAGMLVGWFLCLAPVGIIVGIAALRRVRRFSPGGRRRGQAIAGIILGAVSLIMTVLMTIAAVLLLEQTHSNTPSQVGQTAASQTVAVESS